MGKNNDDGVGICFKGNEVVDNSDVCLLLVCISLLRFYPIVWREDFWVYRYLNWEGWNSIVLMIVESL